MSSATSSDCWRAPVLGLVAGLARPRPFAPAIEWALVVAAAALVVACWWAA